MSSWNGMKIDLSGSKAKITPAPKATATTIRKKMVNLNQSSRGGLEMEKQKIIISNIFVGATEPECETHNSCGFNNGICEEVETHRWIAALDRGQQIKSGIKIVDIKPNEINAFIEVCKEYIKCTNSWSMGDRDEAEAAQPVNRAMKRLLKKLVAFDLVVEG